MIPEIENLRASALDAAQQSNMPSAQYNADKSQQANYYNIGRSQQASAQALNQLFQGYPGALSPKPKFDPRQPLTAHAARLLGASNAWHHPFSRPLSILKG